MATESDALTRKFSALRTVMDERTRRLWAASEARELGYGAVSAVSRATGLARGTILAGLKELDQGLVAAPRDVVSPQRVRRPGAGRKALTERNPRILAVLETLVDPTTRGDPQSPLRWTCKSVRTLAEEMARRGHPMSYQKVSELLHEAGYSLQANRKTQEGTSHPDRNAQFEHIAKQTAAFQRRRQPGDLGGHQEEEELVGNFKNGGREWHFKGEPVPVRVHDFQDADLGKAIPYGVYDLSENAGWVSVGTDHDTPAFAVETVHRWWRRMGRRTYPRARELLITADSGGSNAARARLWKLRLQWLADTTGLRVSVSHFPPGTSKWNKIEHRMFCHITENWRGQPLVSHEVIVNLIANTKTTKGLRIQAALDTREYPLGVKVDDEELDSIRLVPHEFHGDWNYTISPRPRR